MRETGPLGRRLSQDWHESGQPGLQSEFLASLRYSVRPYLKKEEKKKIKIKIKEFLITKASYPGTWRLIGNMKPRKQT